jgi:hypothetical protein
VRTVHVIYVRVQTDNEESRFLKIPDCTFTDTTTIPTTSNVKNKIIQSPFGDKVNYTGTIANGLPKGYGSGHYFELNRPYVYTGFWYQGQNNGQGEAVWEDGDIYRGMWDAGLMNGQGTFKWSNGNVYEGNLKPYDFLFMNKYVHKLQCNH